MTRKRPIAVLFDLDGTLIDTVPFILKSVRHAFAGHARVPTDAEWIAEIGTPLRDQIAEFAARPEDAELIFQRYRTFWLEHHDAETRAFDGALDVVRALREAGHPLGVVTAKIEVGAHRSLRHVGLDAFMGAVVAADSGVPAKPAPDGVVLAARRLDRLPEEALFVGDSPHDVAAGNAAGAVSVGALWGACTREQLAVASPRHYAASLREVPAIVEALRRRQA
ncbi:MAG TPA: HAD-IA family hydrolase [Anaeromyxobacteraceae bacterium]|nr:HAD-IA family hydrolase [Anaeromyxobacteraceae bacterium]